MKITRHTGPDIRHALRAVRDSLGADAVILATRRTAHGVEITAAMDFDAESVQDCAPPATFAPPIQPAVDPEPAPFAPMAVAEPAVEVPVTAPASDVVEAPADKGPVPTLDANNDEMTAELKTLRRMLETQLAQLAWKDLTSRAPLHSDMLRELTEIGIEQGLAAEIVTQLPKNCDATLARRHLGASLDQRLPVTGDQWLENGGRIALIGPTGVGKTTVLAKLAVRWVLRHGSRDLALVAGDSVRIGAQDQVRALGQLLGVPVFALDGLEQLPGVLARLGRFRMVLIDTPGAGQRDASLAQRLLQLSRVGDELQTALVLAASTQAGAIEEAVRRFAPARPASCVLTKVDEAVSLGGMLSVLVRNRLPIAYVSEGQRVPEDLRPARSAELIAAAIHLAQTNGATADEDLLKRRFGDVAHALA
ncbi:MAG TPA: flagellar biosynthesis protein FlhF [Steroidobacteraceae bacterium]|nr:flagellar biosynthesis protein FlhF [Steroidobacteraceae bacterium]